MEKDKTIKLPRIVAKSAKRPGRGYGSGKGGHTVGRGQKGQKARTSVPILFEGMKTKKSLIRRLPQLRGKLKFKANPRPVIVDRSELDKLPAGTKVDVDALVKYNLVDSKEAKKYGVKIVGKGKLAKKLDIVVPTSGKTKEPDARTSEIKTKK